MFEFLLQFTRVVIPARGFNYIIQNNSREIREAADKRTETEEKTRRQRREKSE